MKPEIYVSTDIEADGRIPGVSSMLSLASAAYAKNKKVRDTFSVNLQELPGAKPDVSVMTWWKKYPKAWKACRLNQEKPKAGMKKYYKWLMSLKGKPVFVGYPAAYDFMWVYWYLMRFVGKSPFLYSALDIKTLSLPLLNVPFHKIRKSIMPRRWFDNLPHTHHALDDALQQGALFCNIMAELKAMDSGKAQRR